MEEKKNTFEIKKIILWNKKKLNNILLYLNVLKYNVLKYTNQRAFKITLKSNDPQMHELNCSYWQKS